MSLCSRIILALLACGIAVAQSGKIRVQVVTGGHPYDIAFEKLFEGNAKLETTVNPHPSSYLRDMRPLFDVLVLYDLVQEINDRERKNLQDFLESGKGMVVLHHAAADYNDWPWWVEQVVGGMYRMKPEGGQPRSAFKLDETVAISKVGRHPIIDDLPPMRFEGEETYSKMWISPNVHVILKTDNPKADGPIAWISPYNRSRVDWNSKWEIPA